MALCSLGGSERVGSAARDRGSLGEARGRGLGRAARDREGTKEASGAPSAAYNKTAGVSTDR